MMLATTTIVVYILCARYSNSTPPPPHTVRATHRLCTAYVHQTDWITKSVRARERERGLVCSNLHTHTHHFHLLNALCAINFADLYADRKVHPMPVASPCIQLVRRPSGANLCECARARAHVRKCCYEPGVLFGVCFCGYPRYQPHVADAGN